MSIHPASWHKRQLAHVRECIAEADKDHSPEELAAAEAALSVPRSVKQASLFNSTNRARDVREAVQ